jgi:hypothetical protein
MTTESTDAMIERITSWLPRAKRERDELNVKIEDAPHDRARKVLTKQRDTIQHQIDVLERELDEPVTDAFEANSRGNIEMGMSG